MKAVTWLTFGLGAALLLLATGEAGNRDPAPPETRWRNSSLAGLRHIASALLISESPMESLLARDDAKGREVKQASAEEVLAPVLAKLSMPSDLLVHGEYQLRIKAAHPDAKTVAGKWGSSYNTWSMPLDRWKLASHFVWYLKRDIPLPFPILWDKKPELCGEITHVLTIQGVTFPVPTRELQAYLAAANQWVTLESLRTADELVMLRSGAVEERIPALRLLGARKDREHVPQIAECLKDDDPEVRRAAVWALGMIGGAGAAEHLEANIRDGSSGVREEIALALGEIGGPATVQALAALLKDKDRDVRKNAAMAMAATGSERGIPYLVQALGDEDKATRQAALESLIKLGWQPPKQDTDPGK